MIIIQKDCLRLGVYVDYRKKIKNVVNNVHYMIAGVNINEN